MGIGDIFSWLPSCTVVELNLLVSADGDGMLTIRRISHAVDEVGVHFVHMTQFEWRSFVDGRLKVFRASEDAERTTENNCKYMKIIVIVRS